MPFHPVLHRCTAALVLALVAACSGGGGGDASGSGIALRIEVPPLPLPTGLPSPVPIQLENAFPALVFDRPVFLTAPPDGTNRLFVVEQPGVIRVFPNDPAATATTQFLDLTSQVQFGGEEGLLGFACHPDYATNGWFYVYYTRGSPRRSVLSRFTVSSGDPDVADPGSEVVLLEIPQPFSNHNAGALAFGPDGKLYVASGDGGSGNDPFDNGQSLTTLLGKVLRLEPDGSVPADNPFVGSGAGVRGEIWAYGLRNPWRMSFDRGNGRLWLGDVGQGAEEEIDIVERGSNHGWRVYEGQRSNINPAGLPATAFTPPVHSYPRSQGASITGGYVYRGTAVPALVGAYVYGDFVSGTVWALVHDGVQVVQNVEIVSTSSPASFGEDEAGELYVCCFDGRIRRFTPATAPLVTEMPALLSATGLFADTAALQPTPGVIEYDVNAELWSDDASKRRWIALPGPSRLRFSAGDAYEFPIGTALVKHFELQVAPGTVRRLETRVLLHHESGWHGYTYRWNDGGTDADLVDTAGADLVLTIQEGSATRQQTWHFPSRAECLSCHTAAAGRVLGIRTPQLNRSFAYPLRTANQLLTWNHIGLFTTDIGAASAYAAYVDPRDANATLDDRARTYLDVNCSQCHRPNGPVPVDLDLRFGVASAAMQAFGIAATNAVPGGSGLRITTGDHVASDLWQRMGRRDAFGMPPLGSSLVDADALDLLAAWIDAGPPPR